MQKSGLVMQANGAAGNSIENVAFVALLVLSFAFLIIFHGLETDLPRDNAIYLYSAIEATKGTPPYLSLFDIKTPLTSLYYAPAILIADVVKVDYLTMARLWSVATTSLSCGILFLILRRMGFGLFIALLASLSLIAIPGFALQTVTGGRPKVLMVLLFLLTWHSILKERPLRAGMAAGFATLTWQPAGILMVAAFMAYLTYKKIAAAANVFGGAVFAGAMVLAYFVLEGALYAFFEGSLLVQLNFLERSADANLIGNIKTFLYNLPHLYGGLLLVGLLSPLCLFVNATKSHSVMWVFLLITFAGFFLWTLADNQSYPDLFWLVPFSAVSFAVVLQALLREDATENAAGSAGKSSGAVWGYGATAGLLSVALLFSIYYSTCSSCEAIHKEKLASVELVMSSAEPQEILAIDAPDFLVLSGLSDPNRHMVINSGIDKYIEATQPGGFRGWFDRIYAIHPKIVVLGGITGTHVHYVHDTLERDCDVVDTTSWTIWECSKPD